MLHSELDPSSDPIYPVESGGHIINADVHVSLGCPYVGMTQQLLRQEDAAALLLATPLTTSSPMPPARLAPMPRSCYRSPWKRCTMGSHRRLADLHDSTDERRR